jgi:YbgC/YbaW family acyl-CoA thioester hydrolase
MKFIYKQRVNFYDCDPAGIMFYGNVYRLCHSAYEKLIEDIIPGEDYWNSKDFVVPIIKSEASYHKPFVYGDTASVEINVAVLKGSSFELNYTCTNEKNEVCVKVKTVHVFVDKQSWKKTTITNTIAEGLKKYIKD